MFILLGVLIDAAVLTFVLTLVGQVNVFEDFMRPLAVVLYSIVIGAIAGLLLRDFAWGIPRLLVSIAAIYFLVGYFFDLTTKKKWLVVGVHFGIRIVISFLFV
jgi:hypothetical protein